MDLSKIKLFSLMQTNLNYLSTRQDTLAENVANANTPGYEAKDVQPLDFNKVFKSVNRSVAVNTTNANHISPKGQSNTFGVSEVSDTEAFEISPTGNKVVLEQEMIKITKNGGQYQMTTNLYSKMLSLMQSALGDPR